MEACLVDCLATIQDCVTVPTLTGSEDTLILACGSGKCGSLRAATLGGSITPSLCLSNAASPDSELYVLRGPIGSRISTLLAITSAASETTTLLDVSDTCVHPIRIDDVLGDVHSLCLHSTPSGLLVQVRGCDLLYPIYPSSHPELCLCLVYNNICIGSKHPTRLFSIPKRIDWCANVLD